MKDAPAEFVLEDDPSYVAVLPQVGGDPVGNLVLLADNAEGLPDALGVVWRLAPVETETKADGDAGALAARLDTLLRNLPEGTPCQCILRTSRVGRAKLDTWEKATRTDDPILAQLASTRRAAIERLSIPGAATTFEAREIEVLFTLFRPGTWPETPAGVGDTLAAALSPASPFHRRVGAAYAKDRERFLELAKTVETLFTQADVRFERLDLEAVAGELYAALNPRRSRSMPVPPARGRELLRERAAQSALRIDVDTGELMIDHTYLKIVSATGLPDETHAGLFTRSEGALTFLDTVPEMDLVLNFHVEDQEKMRARFGADRRLATDQSKDAHQSPTMQPHVAELSEIARELASGKRVLSMRLAAIVRGNSPDEAQERARAVHAAFQTHGFGAVIEETLAGGLFLQTLPLGYRPASDAGTGRARKVVSLNVAHALPLYGSFQGTPASTQLFLNRRGEPVTFGFFNDKAVAHGVVTGQSGVGKSVLMNDLILNALRTGARVFVLDKDGSYRHLTEMLDGTYVTYSGREPRRLNPCGPSPEDGLCPEDKNSLLRDLLTEMCTHGKHDLSVRDQNLLSMAVRKAYASKPGKVVVLSDCARALRDFASEHPAAKDLAVCLADYVDGGPYARIFDGPDEIDFGNRLVVVDLAGAALEESVASVLVMALMHRIGEAARALPAIDKYLLVDEAWTLLQSEASARFIANAARTARKQRLALLVISQQITDLGGAIGRTILAQANYHLCLSQKPEAIPAAAEILKLSPREVKVYESVKTVWGSYSEILVKTPWSAGVVRLALDPLSYWISTSDPKDRALLARLEGKVRAKGTTGREALRLALLEAALRFPHGAPSEGAAIPAASSETLER